MKEFLIEQSDYIAVAAFFAACMICAAQVMKQVERNKMYKHGK